MIVDCHARVWESPEQLGGLAATVRERGGHRLPALAKSEKRPLDASTTWHRQCGKMLERSLILGFKSRYLDAEIPNAFVAEYVGRFPDQLLGVAGIDPTHLSEALDDLAAAREQHRLKAITVSPAAQDFHPSDSRAMQVFAEAARLGMPVFIDQGIVVGTAAKMEFARPALLDEVARELPDLRLVIAHLGYPWVEECIVLLSKHPAIYADVSSLFHRPWHAYNAIVSAYQYGVADRLLFGSDFPFSTPASAIESLYRVNQLVTGTNLPTVPRPYLAGIVERDALGLLGLAPSTAAGQSKLLDSAES